MSFIPQPRQRESSGLHPEARKRLYTTFYDVLNELRALPDTDVYVTGSNSETLSSDIATNFRDRGFEIRLHPLRFSKYLAATGLSVTI